MDIIDKFHQDPDVFIFLISTMAGGTGLNLTGANKVVIFGISRFMFSIFRLTSVLAHVDPNWSM
jgi:hypothetical protein